MVRSIGLTLFDVFHDNFLVIRAQRMRFSPVIFNCEGLYAAGRSATHPGVTWSSKATR